MRKTVLVLLLVTSLLVASAEASWFRNVFTKAKSAVKKNVDKVKGFVKTHSSKVIDAPKWLPRMFGKRSAELPCSPEDQEMQEAALLVTQLQEACPTFGIDPDAGLTEKAVNNAFDVSDDNKDGALSEEELTMFENIMDVYEECVTMELAKRR